MQLQAATAATVQLEGSLRQKAEQCGRMEAELAGLQQTGQELTGQLRTEHASTVEFKQRSDTLETSLRESAGELERLKADRQKQAAEQARLESQLQEQLTAAKAAAEQAEASRREEADRNRDFEERLRVCANNLKQEQERLVQRYEADAAGLKQERDSLHQQLGEAQRAAAAAGEQSAAADSRFRQLGSTLEQAKADLKKQTSERSAAEADLRSQLSAAKAAAKKAEDALRQKNAQSTRYEQELTNFRQERHEIHDKFAAEQQAVTKAKRRIKELENQVQRDAGELARLKTDADRGAAERGRTESALRAELATARNSAKKSDAACEAQATQGERLKEELIVLRQLQEELSARQTSEQNNAGEARRQIEDLEQRLRQNAAELGRTQAALENQAAELARQASAQPHPAAASDELEKECGRLRETEAAQTAQLSELDRRVRESVASLARATADLEKERGERRRIEQRSGAMTAQLQELHEKFKQQLGADRAAQERITHLEQQMLEREDAHTRVSADLQQEAAARQLAEDQLRTTADLSSHLRNCLSSFAQAKSGFKVMQDQLEAQIQAHQSALHEREERLQKEIAERQRLEEALAGTRRTLQEHSQGKAIEMAKLQSEVQMHEFERTRLQSEAVQSRYATVDSARVGSAMLNSFRRQIRQPVDHLLQTSRRLLEAGLEAEQKKLAESVLENALLLQSSVQEGASPAGSTRSGDPQLKTEAPAEQRPASDNLQA